MSPSPDVTADADAERPGPPVAGIGASAGGLDAFKKFFKAMPADSGIAFVLIPHLDPKHESLMVELIARHTTMSVVEAADGMAVGANHIYIIPPNKYITIAEGVLRLTGPVERAGPQTSIDVFLRSLADDKREKAICIILSGTGSHGTLGLQAVKAAGGLAIVQEPETADYPAMPQSAIATGLADHILPVEQMSEALKTYVEHYYVNGREAERADAADDLNQVLALLRARKKLDFRCYRKRMLIRRVERRMSLSHFNSIPDYLAFLREHPDEVNHLSRDLLISVTSFFRDPEAWDALETQVIAPLVRAREPDGPLRFWSAGCATGEEPYSLGIVALEQLAAAQKCCSVQIFATDVDEDALQVARQAIYPESIATDVSAERLSQFFTRMSDVAYQVSKQLRETVIFARQNLITEAPFSKLDLIVCRNLLIYLEPEIQKKVVSLLHFSLNPGGYLFLGPSETIGRNIDLFEVVSARWRIYRRIGASRVDSLQFPVMQLEPRPSRPFPASKRALPPKLGEVAQNSLLRRYALACVVINRNYEVLHFAGPTEDYLVQPVGPPTQDLLSLARSGLQSKLRLVVQRAIRENAPQSIKDVMVKHAGVTRRVNIDAEPLSVSKETDGLLLVAFQEQSRPGGETRAETKARVRLEESDLTRQLEQELETTREDLQSTIEELESSNEELKASNEEIMSMNEELQSSNEELETSKEELQSLNEELSTVNGQLQEKVHDLEVANNDMANLFNCTNIPTLFLDMGLRIKRFTPATTRLFNLIAGDVGRPISDIVRKFADDGLLRDCQEFLHDLVPREKEVRTEDGRWCVRRLVPYRTLDNRIDGIVMTFVDITERKLAADTTVKRLAAVVESSADAIYNKDLDGTIRTWNLGAEKLYGYAADEIIGRSVSLIIPEDRAQEFTHILSQLADGEPVQQLETERLRKDGQRIPVSITMSPIRDGEGTVVSASVIVRDITERKRAEEALRREHDLTEAIITAAPLIVLLLDPEGHILQFNPFMERLTGWSLEEARGRNWFDTFLPARDRDRVRSLFGRATGGERTRANINPILTKDQREIEIEWYDAPLRDAAGQLVGLLCAGQDITERRRAEEALRERERQLSEDLSDMARLQHCSTRLVQSNDLTPLLLDILETAIGVTRADMGDIQLLNRSSRTLQIVASRGFESPFIEFFNAAHEGEAPCATALVKGKRVVVEDVATSPVFAGTPVLDALRAAGVRAVISTPLVSRAGEIVGMLSVHYRMPRHPADRDLQFLDLLARQGADWIERMERMAAVRDREERLLAILNTAADAIITIDDAGIVQSVNPAAVRMFGYNESEVLGQNVSMLMPSPYREEHDGYLRRYQETGQARIIGIGREVLARRKDGSIFPADLSVSRVDHMKLFTGFIRDVTRYKDLEREVVEIASLQQRRIGEDLHDRVGQELTALNLLVGNLTQMVRSDSEQAAIVERVIQGVRRTQKELRSALHGLVHASLDSDGLPAALSELASRTQVEGALLDCTFDCPEPVSVMDELTATHLYLIAQEAVHNSVKHAQARNIWITLEKAEGGLVLSVRDDGVGMPKSPTETQGLGLRIMQNRAAIIGAKLSITPVEPCGTLVTCTWLGTHDVQERNQEARPRPDR